MAFGHGDFVAPADIVGAIANEAGVDPSGIGAIDIADSFSLVEVPGDEADAIVQALRSTKIRGKKVKVRRDREADRRSAPHLPVYHPTQCVHHPARGVHRS